MAGHRRKCGGRYIGLRHVSQTTSGHSVALCNFLWRRHSHCLIVVSTYTKPGHISHDYADHISILKFIERNWGLPTISGRSRDNLLNPTYNTAVSLYAPTNSPAISDLFDLFNF
jgi:hypothetical protein